MDYSKGWHEGMSLEDTKNLAYYERNMVALFLANQLNLLAIHEGSRKPLPCGWYYDTDNNWDGWKRVLSIGNGTITFHVPDDFDLGNLHEIAPNWNGHSTEEKWNLVKKCCEIPIIP